MKNIFILFLVFAMVGGLLISLKNRDRLRKELSPVQTAAKLDDILKTEKSSANSNNPALQNADNSPTPTMNADNKKLPPPDKAYIDPAKKYIAVLKTEAGEIAIALNAAGTPYTVNNFVYLAKNNFYNNTVFHRVIPDFMIQGGDPRGDGTGGPGYYFQDEKFTGEYTRGTVAMANAGPNTNGSQFFIMQGEKPLEKNYVIFGKVLQGMEVVDKIVKAPTKPDGEGSTPENPVRILEVNILSE